MRRIWIGIGLVASVSALGAAWRFRDARPKDILRASAPSEAAAPWVTERSTGTVRARPAAALRPTGPRELGLVELWMLRARQLPAAERAPLVDDVDADDARALAGFDAAFDAEARDEPWSAGMETSIADVLQHTADGPVLDDVECRATLCRVELRGTMGALPLVDPFTSGTAWWIGGEDGSATLMLARDGFADPFTS